MARKVKWTAAAWNDLEEAADYIARDSPNYAAALVREVREAARSLSRCGRARPDGSRVSGIGNSPTLGGKVSADLPSQQRHRRYPRLGACRARSASALGATGSGNKMNDKFTPDAFRSWVKWTRQRLPVEGEIPGISSYHWENMKAKHAHPLLEAKSREQLANMQKWYREILEALSKSSTSSTSIPSLTGQHN